MASVDLKTVSNTLYWEPKEDITVYELSVALGVLLPASGGTLRDLSAVVAEMPTCAQRHFRTEPPR
jgi:hypothetical protein